MAASTNGNTSGNTDMASNGNGFDPLAQYARLSERVENQGKDIVDLRSNMNTGFQNVNANISALANDFRATGKTQWPIIIGFCSVTITVLGGLGFLAIQPIKDNIAQIRQDAQTLSATTATGFTSFVDKMVTQKEMEWRTARGAEDRKRTDDGISDLRANTVSRNEWSERNHARDGEIAELGRRINEIRQDVGSQYTTRDVLLSTQSEVKDLRNQLRRLYESRYGPSETSREATQ